MSDGQKASEILPIKQGLKLDLQRKNKDYLITASEILPIKQGLKLKEVKAKRFEKGSLRDTSNKTRIETLDNRRGMAELGSASEILPIKQGLKQHLQGGEKR